MSFEFVTITEKMVAGPWLRTGNHEPDAMQKINDVWMGLFSGGFSQIPAPISKTVYGIYTNYENDVNGQYDFVGGLQVSGTDNLPAAMKAVPIPAGRYAKFSFVGNPQTDLGGFWQQVWDTQLDRIYTCDFEEYLHSEDTAQTPVNIYIAVG